MGMHSAYVMKLGRDELERRRLAAAKDLRAGIKQAEVARRYHASPASVCRWAKALHEEGVDGLKRRDAPGKPSHLTEEQWTEVESALREGAAAHGFKNDVWTGERVQRFIRERFGVEYNANYMIEVLKTRFHLSWQKPHRVARERDDEKRREWIETTWTEVKKGRSKGAGR